MKGKDWKITVMGFAILFFLLFPSLSFTGLDFTGLTVNNDGSMSPTSTEGQIMLNEISVARDYVEMRNTGPSQDMTGWQVRIFRDNAYNFRTYIFPNGWIFLGGSVLILLEGSGVDSGNTLYAGWNFLWMTNVAVGLLNRAGATVDWFQTNSYTGIGLSGAAWDFDATITFTYPYASRITDLDTNKASDWRITSSGSLGILNPGQTPPNPDSPPGIPILTLLPSPNTDGIINLEWSLVEGALSYFVYRDTSFFSSVEEKIPIAETQSISFQDTLTYSGTYYYVVVASNEVGNSSISNFLSIAVQLPPPPPPYPYPISPNPNIDGSIYLQWREAAYATCYLIYRDTNPVTSTDALTPIHTTTELFYYDNVTVNGTYYYAIIATNAAGPSRLSISVDIEVSIPNTAPDTPDLYSIDENPDHDGYIRLSWSESSYTTHYYIYRDVNPITSADELTPIGSTTDTRYFDFLGSDGTYNYAVVACNVAGNSSLSNQETVQVDLPYNNHTPASNLLLLLITIGMIAIGVYSSYYAVHKFQEERRIQARLERIKARDELSRPAEIPLPEYARSSLADDELITSSTGTQGEIVRPIAPRNPSMEIEVSPVVQSENTNHDIPCMTFIERFRMVKTLTAIFPTLEDLLPPSELSSYLLDLGTLSEAEISSCITRLITVIPMDELLSGIPLLMREMNALPNSSILDSVSAQISDLFLLVGSQENRPLMNELVMLTLLVRFTTIKEVNVEIAE